MKKVKGGVLVFLGFWLSPLSPWNDLFTNIPIAYVFGLVFSIISETLFFPMVIIGYWLSNIAGFVLMHYGYVVMNEKSYSFKNSWKQYVFWTSVYTLLVSILIFYNILPSADEVINFFT